MAHKCTWKGCGAPATKKIHLRLKNPWYTQLHRDGSKTREYSEGKDLWRCEKHYPECVRLYSDSEFFIIDT